MKSVIKYSTNITIFENVIISCFIQLGAECLETASLSEHQDTVSFLVLCL